MARKIQSISDAKREILVLTAPSFVRSWDPEQFETLLDAAKSGLSVKVYLNHKPLFPIRHLARMRACGIQVREGSRRWLGVDSSTEEEFWIFDRESALGGNRSQCRELEAQPDSGRLSVECPLARAPAKTAARYFDHRWDGHPESVALVVRHKEFSFRGGKGAEKDFLVYASRARKEISLCLTDTRISSRLCSSLLDAMKRGVKVRVYSNSFGMNRLRSRLLFGRLLRAGAVLRFTAEHRPLETECALFDQHSVYLGALPGSVRGWGRIPRPVFFLHDKDLHAMLSVNLEKQIGHQISSMNSKGFLTQAPAPQRRTRPQL